MRVIVWGINYAPEVTGIGPYNAALCEYFRDAGHDVEMVTTFAYYPSWRRRSEDEGVAWRTHQVEGVPVHRCWHYVPATVRAWKRILHEASFICTSLMRVLTLPRADVIVAVSPPLLLGPAAWLASRLKRTGYVFHVQDLQPDAAVSLGMLEEGVFTRLLYAIESWSYGHAWAVSGISEGMLRAFESKGVTKRIHFPNGIEMGRWPDRGAFRKRLGLGDDDLLVTYSGNLGIKQGLSLLIEVADRLRDGRVRIVICGDGADRQRLIDLAAKSSRVTFLPLLPEAGYRELMVDSDLAIIPQVPGSGGVFFPSKLLPALAAERPILSIADETSELARAVRESGCGWNLVPSDIDQIAAHLDGLASERTELQRRGAAGRVWVEQFEKRRVLAAYVDELERLVERAAIRAGGRSKGLHSH